MANCPSCGSPLAGDETFCLQCGERLVPEPEPEPRWGVPAAIVGGIALLAVAGIFFALRQVESDAEREATKPSPVVKPPAAVTTDENPTDVAVWPAGSSAYTVVLATTQNEAAARARAAAAVAGGIPAGVLDSSGHPELEPGPWVLFAGSYATRDEAAVQATRYAAAGFPGAEPHFVRDTRDPADAE